MKPTTKARQFMKANDESRVVSGASLGVGQGGSYALEDGRTFRLSLADCRSLPEGYPKWVHAPMEMPKHQHEKKGVTYKVTSITMYVVEGSNGTTTAPYADKKFAQMICERMQKVEDGQKHR